jgi:hypothetical protein
MGKSKSVDKTAGETEGDNSTLATREELEQLSMDMQKKLDDFAQGQIELSRQQSVARLEFNKRFDQLTSLLAHIHPPPPGAGTEAGTSDTSNKEPPGPAQGGHLGLSFTGPDT